MRMQQVLEMGDQVRVIKNPSLGANLVNRIGEIVSIGSFYTIKFDKSKPLVFLERSEFEYVPPAQTVRDLGTELNQLKKLHKASSPGEWRIIEYMSAAHKDLQACLEVYASGDRQKSLAMVGSYNRANAEFMAAACNYVSKLVSSQNIND